MILLDTNIISEIMKSGPAIQVLSWFDRQDVAQLFVTSITIAEISYGINSLPEGKRRSYLDNAFNKAIIESFKYRVLYFDGSAAHFYGTIMSNRKKSGRPMSILDGQIAAIARANAAVVATRNTRDFEDCELELVNPFEVVS